METCGGSPSLGRRCVLAISLLFLIIMFHFSLFSCLPHEALVIITEYITQYFSIAEKHSEAFLFFFCIEPSSECSASRTVCERSNAHIQLFVCLSRLILCKLVIVLNSLTKAR